MTETITFGRVPGTDHWVLNATGGLATKHDIEQLERKIMSAIGDFAAKQTAFNARLGAAIDGVAADVDSLNAKIVELQNTAGAITPEDQALLDELQAQGEALASRLEAVDALTPPPPPAG